MAVAVRLVEVLTLVTLLGLITGFSIFVVFAERIMTVFLFFVGPVAYVISFFLYYTEQVLVYILLNLLSLANQFGLSVDSCGA